MTKEEAISLLFNISAYDIDNQRGIKKQEAIEMAIEALKADVPNTNVGKWIPCSERLPEDVEIGEEYPNVIFCTDSMSYTGFYDHYKGKWWTADGDDVCLGVIAWMPLPEPYKEEQDAQI